MYKYDSLAFHQGYPPIHFRLKQSIVAKDLELGVLSQNILHNVSHIFQKSNDYQQDNKIHYEIVVFYS